jgi:hypothetical protein
MRDSLKLGITGAGLLGMVAWSSFAADELPQPQTFARYDAMLNRSPFAVASAPVAAPAATPNFAKDLYIANLARTPDGGLVTVASSTDKNFKKYLNTRESIEGYLVTDIEWSDRIGQSKVTISKDGQFATLTFNQAVLAQPVSAGMPIPAQPQQAIQPVQAQPIPGQVTAVPAATPYVNPAQPANGTNGTTIKPAPIPMLPTPPPRMRGVIQRNPDAQVQPADAAAQKAGVQSADNE